MSNFTEVVRKVNKKIYLNEDFAMAAQPVGLRGITLYPHQCTALAALLDIEAKRQIRVKRDPYADAYVETSAAVFSDSFGSGKTFVILALIITSPVPRAMALTRYSHPFILSYKYSGRGSFIRPNLVVVGSSVVGQWHNCFIKHTDLKVLVVADIRDYREFKRIYDAGALGIYNVVLLKNGPISAPEQANGHEARNMVELIYYATMQSVWARVVYDDFDTIRIPARTPIINSLFTVYVSATRRVTMVSAHSANNTLSKSVKTPRLLDNVVGDGYLFTVCNVCNDKSFIEACIHMPIINAYKYKYANPNRNIVDLIGMLNKDADIVEMINGDAIATAADTLGITAKSVGDIFQKILDDNYADYARAQKTIQLIEDITADQADLKPGTHSTAALEHIRNRIIKLKRPEITAQSAELANMLENMVIEFTTFKDKYGKAISRVQDNLKEGECQVCALPLDTDVIIVKCCGIILCDVCGLQCNQLKNQHDRVSGTNKLLGTCANCRARVDPRHDLVFINRDFDLEKILEGIAVEPETAEPEPTPAAPEPPIQTNPKLAALTCILRGGEPVDRVKFNLLRIAGLLEGRTSRPQPAGLRRKVIIFANYAESIQKTAKALDEIGASYVVLQGSYRQKNKIVEEFEHNYDALLINSSETCAGLNLQYCTDIVFMHRINDTAVEAQLCGRAQRVGRVYDLNIHYLLFDTEDA